MITVIANNFVKEGCLDEFLSIAEVLVEETNKLDPGCIRYAMHQSLSDPLLVTCMEEWASREDMENHLKSAHFLKSVGEIKPYGAKPTTVTLYKKLF